MTGNMGELGSRSQDVRRRAPAAIVVAFIVGAGSVGGILFAVAGIMLVSSVTAFSGEEDEVIRAAAEHAASVHGMKDTPELREQFRSMLKDEAAL